MLIVFLTNARRGEDLEGSWLKAGPSSGVGPREGTGGRKS